MSSLPPTVSTALTNAVQGPTISSARNHKQDNFEALGIGLLPDTDPLIKCCKKGDTEKLLSILAPLSSNRICEYINTPDRNGSTAIFHTVWPGHTETLHTLLTYNANPNHQNNKLNTALHVACEQSHRDIILLLLSYDANPHLVNSHGQRCYEMGNSDRKEKTKMENLVKKIWQDLRRTNDRSKSGLLSSNSNTTAVSSSAVQFKFSKPSTPAFFKSGYHQRSYYQDINTKYLQHSLQPKKEIPLLMASLLWNEDMQREDQLRLTQEREHGEEDSLFLRLWQEMENKKRKKEESIRRKQLIGEGGEAAIVATHYQQQLRYEQQEREYRQQLRARERHMQKEEHHQYLLHEAEERRRGEIRRVLRESAYKDHKRNHDRILTQLWRNMKWTDKIKKKEEAERRRIEEMKTRNQNGLFLTEVAGQECELEEEEDDEDEEADEDYADLENLTDDNADINNDGWSSDWYRLPRIQPQTRKYLSRILTEHFTLLPPKASLVPATAPKTEINYPKRTTRKKPHKKSTIKEQEENTTIMWKDPEWNPMNTQTNNPEQTQQQKELRGTYTKGSRLSRPDDNEDVSEAIETCCDEALLSAMVLKQMQKRQEKALAHKRQLKDQAEQIERRKRKETIRAFIPTIDETSSLYTILMNAPKPTETPTVNENSSHEEEEDAVHTYSEDEDDSDVWTLDEAAMISMYQRQQILSQQTSQSRSRASASNRSSLRVTASLSAPSNKRSVIATVSRPSNNPPSNQYYLPPLIASRPQDRSNSLLVMAAVPAPHYTFPSQQLLARTAEEERARQQRAAALLKDDEE